MHSDSQNRRPLSVILLFVLFLIGFAYWIQSFSVFESLNVSELAKLIRLFAVVLLWIGATLHWLGKSSNETLRTHSFSIAVATGSTLLLTGYRFLIGAGLGLQPFNEAEISSGFLYYPEDNFSYASWAAQSVHEAFLFQNLYTMEDHRAVYFNPFFVLLGLIARILNASVIPLMIAVGILSSLVVIFCVFQICRKMEFPDSATRWATLLAAFSSGMSAPVYYLAKWFGQSVPVGSDLRYMDSILFSTFYALPYQSFAYALLAITVLVVFRCERENSTFRDFAILGTLQAFSVLTRPYEWFLLLAGYAIYLVLPGHFNRKRFWILVVLGAATAPAALYNWWLSHQAVWQNFAQISLTQEKFRLYWLLGYGLSIPLAILAAVPAWKNPRLVRARWAVITTCLSISLLVLFNVPYVKMASCGHLFLCIAAGLGFHAILSWVKEIKQVSLKILAGVSLIPVPLLLFGSSLFLLLAYFHTDKMDSEFLEIAKAIRPGSAVLCNNADGSILPAISGARVYSGHWTLTPGYSSDKKRNLMQAGMERGYDANQSSFERLLASEHFDFVLVQKSQPAYEFIRSHTGTQLVRCYAKRCLFTTHLR